MRKEYLGTACAMDLPKGHELRKQLNSMKVQLGNLMDETKDLDLDVLTQSQFDRTMEECKKKA